MFERGSTTENKNICYRHVDSLLNGKSIYCTTFEFIVSLVHFSSFTRYVGATSPEVRVVIPTREKLTSISRSVTDHALGFGALTRAKPREVSELVS